MNKVLAFGVALVLALGGLALTGESHQAQAGHGCHGCHGGGGLFGGCHGRRHHRRCDGYGGGYGCHGRVAVQCQTCAPVCNNCAPAAAPYGQPQPYGGQGYQQGYGQGQTFDQGAPPAPQGDQPPAPPGGGQSQGPQASPPPAPQGGPST